METPPNTAVIKNSVALISLPESLEHPGTWGTEEESFTQITEFLTLGGLYNLKMFFREAE